MRGNSNLAHLRSKLFQPLYEGATITLAQVRWYILASVWEWQTLLGKLLLHVSASAVVCTGQYQAIEMTRLQSRSENC